MKYRFFQWLAFISLTFVPATSALQVLPQHNDGILVYIQDSNHPYYVALAQALKDFNITFQLVTTLNPHDEHLYIIFDIHTVQKETLPPHYIVYQTLHVTRHNVTSDFINKLAHAIVVWDYSRDNIAQYQHTLHNYHYFPPHYEFTDPIILPCFLPKEGFNIYKELVIYENKKNTDISSHLPTLFCHSFLAKPSVIVELGVRGGESTLPLSKTAVAHHATLFGVDIAPDQNVYTKIKNASFFCMNDIDFADIFPTTNDYKKCDIVFIDTSHIYEHTLKELQKYVPLLSDHGFIAFHDSNVTPLPNSGYIRLNGTMDWAGGNPRGVTQGLKEYFALDFDEYNYFNTIFTHNGIQWHIIHYSFCNGLTILNKIKTI